MGNSYERHSKVPFVLIIINQSTREGICVVKLKWSTTVFITALQGFSSRKILLL